MSTKIPAFIDGNTLVHYGPDQNKLFVGNDAGVVKVFNLKEPDSEPISLDIPDNLTSLKSWANKIVTTNTEGKLALITFNEDVSGDESYSVVYESQSPLRDAEIINEGKRIICGGDSTDVVIIDFLQDNKVETFSVDDKLVNVSYNAVGELVSLGLANGEVHIYSVSNESPELVDIIKHAMAEKSYTSVETIDYTGEHGHELICTNLLWTPSGENVLVPTTSGTVKSFLRSDWSSDIETEKYSETLVAFTISPSTKFLALLYQNGNINIHSLKTFKLIKTMTDIQSGSEILPINLAWGKNIIYVGSTNGELHSLRISLEEDEEDEEDSEPLPNISEVDKLFLDEASDSDTEEFAAPVAPTRKRDALDDSRIIDEDDDDDEQDENGDIDDDDDPFRFRNKSVEDVIASRQKKARLSPQISSISTPATQELVLPYSPGSTPWIKSINSGSSATQRRYLFMNAIGYCWSVKNSSRESSDVQKSVTISFFDRSINKDYHFIDYYDYDLCSMNERGILLGCSGFTSASEFKPHKGRVFYRHHGNTSDSWDRQIPLASTEHITSICITSSSSESSGDSIIVVGTSFGYIRFFNLYGLCINIMKMSPVLSLISSAINTVFSIHHSGKDNFTYSIINVPEDYKFYQQECNLPIKACRGPLLKGLFFNDHYDPCLVAGHDDTLVVLSHWRETSNARWVPLLNCTDAVSDFGMVSSKKNWKCWPLGLQEDKSVCLILKNNDIYPGFPLPLPVELKLKLPTKCYKSIFRAMNKKEDETDEFADDRDDLEKKLQIVKEEDPEEEFLRVSTLGKLLASSLNDLGDEEEHMDTLKDYSLIFDKSLLKLFNSACQESRLNKAFSVAKLIKNDKALLAATKISERHNFANLMNKINKLREDLLESMEDDDDDDDGDE